MSRPPARPRVVRAIGGLTALLVAIAVFRVLILMLDDALIATCGVCLVMLLPLVIMLRFDGSARHDHAATRGARSHPLS